MTVSVTMLQTRLGESGSLWVKDSTYSATDAFATFLINSNFATGILPSFPNLEIAYIKRDASRNVVGVVDGAGKAISAGGGGGPVASNIGSRVFTTGILGANGPSSIFLSGTFLNDGSDVGTEHIALELGEFTEVRLLYANNSPYPMIITGGNAVAAADFSDKAQDAAFATAPPFTYGGGASGMVLPPGVTGFPRITPSDWLVLSSVARTDVVGGTPAMYARTRFALPNGSSHGTTSWDATGADWGTGRFQLWACGMYGDKLNVALSRPPAINNRRVICGVQYRSPYRVMTVMCSGTSLTNNNTSALSRVAGGWVSQAQQLLSTPTKPIETVNWGCSGQSSVQFRANFEANAKVIGFTHAYIELFDTNGSGAAFGQAAQDTNKTNVMAIAQVAEQVYGAKVGGWGGLPRGVTDDFTSYYTAPGEANRLSYLAKMAAIFGSDYVDVSPAVVVPGSSPQLFIPAMQYDRLHPNQTGTDALTPLHAAKWKSWADAYFTN